MLVEKRRCSLHRKVRDNEEEAKEIHIYCIYGQLGKVYWL